MTTTTLQLAEAARIMREAVKDKSYQLLPLGAEAAGYLRAKRKRLTDSSYRDYEAGLDKLARYFADLELHDFEPPVGTQRLYALRKGSLQAVRFQHFDHVRKRLTIFAKGGKVRNVPIPDPAFWHDLERLILDTKAEGHHYLMQRMKGNGKSKRAFPDEPMGVHGLHDWWYRCLANAGIVAEGTTSGERMHKARHSAGQRLLDHTGNLKAVQQLLGHESVATTGDIYVGWDEAALAASLESVLKHEEAGEDG
jgi:integrase